MNIHKVLIGTISTIMCLLLLIVSIVMFMIPEIEAGIISLIFSAIFFYIMYFIWNLD